MVGAGKMRRCVAIAAMVLLAGCTGIQSPLNPAGEQADRLSGLFGLMSWVCGAMYLLVVGFLGISLWRLRRRPAAATPVVDPADTGLRLSLLVWSGIILVGLTVLIVASFLADRSFAQMRARRALEVRVTGHQWWWRLQYRDPATGGWIETANELHLPVGRTTRVQLGSADVIHSFWVPNVAGKMDVIPGRINVIDLSPRRTGWFRGQCAEFCGVQHAHMAFDVKVESQGAFDAWLAVQARDAAAAAGPVLQRGMQVVAGGQCAGCHVIRGTGAVGRAGPDLTHIGGRRSIAAGTLPFSRGALQGWIAQPQALKPGTMMPPVALDPADADAAARYLESLK
jgi:cytochrome c oxidase subunit 2